MVEAAGVGLFNILILRKLLVSLEAKSAKNASLPGRRYKNGTNFDCAEQFAGQLLYIMATGTAYGRTMVLRKEKQQSLLVS